MTGPWEEEAQAGLRLIAFSLSAADVGGCPPLSVGTNIGKLGIQTGKKVERLCVCIKYICACFSVIHTHSYSSLLDFIVAKLP